MRDFFLFILSILLIQACSGSKEVVIVSEVMNMDTVNVVDQVQQAPYQKTVTKHWDLIHTELDLRFDLNNEEVIGVANIKVTPHFYSQSNLVLDAKWMEIKSVKNQLNEDVEYDYNLAKLTLNFSQSYRVKDTLVFTIKYIAKPRTNTDEGGRAIRAAKGVYFINPRGENPNKPTQIWTQGETHFSSCWFPTLDEPNQKSTQEIKLTVEERFTTLSNGILEFSTLNGDGTRTDYWMQDKAHSPYLFMLAIGEFEVTREEWQGVEVSYYLEADYHEDALAIFGNTPEMIDFYSEILGVDYPWDKYSQVVVRDFVSGAMENTSATLHGEFVQNHKRELLDYNPDDIIAHELFHQWFGDLVNCESWSNLPLNEGFATYGEFLWYEHKYGPDEALYKLQKNLKSYLNESLYKQEDWVRFHYWAKDDMFDAHSYSKGSRILHMLRHTVGDAAFFQSLNLYLNRYAHQSAEMHQLRLCFEEVSGEDLNWFFDQWAFNSGHPQLEIIHQYDSSNQVYRLQINQRQESELIYRLPVQIEVHRSSGIELLDVVIDSNQYEINIDGDVPLWVNFDQLKYLLCTKDEQLSVEMLNYKSTHCNNVIDRFEVLKHVSNQADPSDQELQLLFNGFTDPFYGVRLNTLSLSYKFTGMWIEKLTRQVKQLALSDPHPKVRARALQELMKLADNDTKLEVSKGLLQDSSYAVISEALFALVDLDSIAAYKASQQLLEEKNSKIVNANSFVFSVAGSEGDAAWYLRSEPNITGYNKVFYLRNFNSFLTKNKSNQVINTGINLYNKVYGEADLKMLKKECLLGLAEIHGILFPEDENADISNDTREFQREHLEMVYLKIKSNEDDSTLLDLIPDNY